MPLPARRLTSWSFSRYSVYANCPAKARYKFLDKRPEPSSPALARGDAVHKAGEAYLTGKAARLAPELKTFAGELKELRARRRKDPAAVAVEETWAFRRDWSTTVYNDWDGCWLRVKVDFASLDGAEVAVTDLKTGKFREESAAEYLEQLELYALAGLTRFADRGPDLRVTARLLYTDLGFAHPAQPVEYRAKDLAPLRKTWEKRVKPMLNDTTFAPRPNGTCRWCAFRKEVGGPCKF